MSESNLTPIQRALRARQQQMQQSVDELQQQVRRFRRNVDKIPSPSLAPQTQPAPGADPVKG